MGSSLNSSLMELLVSEDITPGQEPSYQLCKTLYAYHPLGGKMVDKPIQLAMSQRRDISIPDSPEERVVEAFEKVWEEIGANRFIENTARLARIYGVSALVCGLPDLDTSKPMLPEELSKPGLYFNSLDPLNTAGSLVLNQDPNSPDFQRPTLVTAAGQGYHPSRSIVMMNEQPLYIQFTTSSFGYVGRSAYQRALYPMKSFIRSMITDEMVTRKAGVLVAKMKPAGSIADRTMWQSLGFKRNVVKESETNNVINITPDEYIETLNMQNADTAMTTARKNIINNIASAANMPAKLLDNESFAEGFGEGTEDAKDVVRFIEGIRGDLDPLYSFFDRIVRYRAWTPEFYETIQNDFPQYKNVDYKTAFYQWSNSFVAKWPSLLVEPESKLVEVAEVKLKSLIATLEVLTLQVDPMNKARLIQWFADNVNADNTMFTSPLLLDYDELMNFVPPTPPQETDEPKPFSGSA